MLALLLDKFGDFMLEVAVLVFVFVPLDFWRGHVSSVQIATVGCVSGGTFFIGLGCLKSYPLKAADALQLAAAWTWCSGEAKNSTFISGDVQLIDAARRIGFSVVAA